jgi:hypothetical protein
MKWKKKTSNSRILSRNLQKGPRPRRRRRRNRRE